MCENQFKKYESSPFQKGWNKLPVGLVDEVATKIMAALSVSSRAQFWRHLNGQVKHSCAECQVIEEIFAGAGVTDIWDI